MKLFPEDDYTITLWGKTFNSVQHMLILFGYIIFLMVPWPIISSSYFFLPLAVVILPCIVPDFIAREIYYNKRLTNFLAYGGVLLCTFIYTHFFLDSSNAMIAFHYPVYLLFPYFYFKRPMTKQ